MQHNMQTTHPQTIAHNNDDGLFYHKEQPVVVLKMTNCHPLELPGLIQDIVN